MPRSRRWKALEREIGGLRREFLPSPFDSLGKYRNRTRVQAHTRAFLVLSHAEIESYIEGWAKEIASASQDVWNSASRITKPLVFLLFMLAERIEVPVTLLDSKRKDSAQKLVEASDRLFQKYYKMVKDNNGIKETNVLALFAPLGVPSMALGTTLLPNLDSLGALRGTHAHESAQAVQSVLDPETEYDRVIALVKDLGGLDEWLVRYRRGIR